MPTDVQRDAPVAEARELAPHPGERRGARVGGEILDERDLGRDPLGVHPEVVGEEPADAGLDLRPHGGRHESPPGPTGRAWSYPPRSRRLPPGALLRVDAY